MKKFCVYAISTFTVIAFLTACSTVQKTAVTGEPETTKPSVTVPDKVIHPTEREAESLNIFSEALSLIESSTDRKTVLPQVEDLYMKIINEYPDAPLAQESYWRLISIYINDYEPPAYEKGESLYHDFLKGYPGSPLRGFIEENLGKSYYKNAKWDKLLEVCTPAFREYTEKGKKSKPSLLFMYAEAHFNMGNLAEAEKAYKIFLDVFPMVSESKKAKERLKDIRRP